MALSWVVDGGRNVKQNFAKLSAQDTFLVEGFYSPFVQAIEEFFNNTPKVKDFQYVINWRVDGGLRSVQQQASKGGGQTGAAGGRSAHNYGMAIDFAPVGLENSKTTKQYKIVNIGRPYAAKTVSLPEPWAVAVEALYNHPTLYSGALFVLPGGNIDFNHIEWKDYRTLARGIAPEYWKGRGGGGTPSRQSYQVPRRLDAPAPTPRGPGISPFISANSSFHPHIQYELTRRRVAAETANSYMPHIKLTSLVKVYNKNLQSGGDPNKFGAYCPTIGIHGRVFTDFDSIYYPSDGRSIVGYATQEVDGKVKSVPVVVESSEDDPPNIPPPGIMSMSAERTTSGGFGVRGGLFKATINIRAYSLGQINALLKYYIRQGTKVVLEIGRQSSSTAENMLSNSTELAGFRSGEGGGLGNTTSVKELFQKFNWQRKQSEIEAELKPFILLETGQVPLIEKYCYNNFGNYELFIGYVASFKLKYTKENVYDIELTVHSVQQFEVSTRLGGTRSSPNTSITVTNPCEAVDIMDYFKPESAYRSNAFSKVLASCSQPDGNLYPAWAAHVIPLRSAGAQAGSGGVTSNGYLISWECFVDLILNDNTYGILGTFQLDSNIDSKTISVLRSGLLSRIGSTQTGNNAHINSNEVSWNANLRSTDLNTMVIYNELAQATRRTDYGTEVLALLRNGGDISEEDMTKIETGIADSSVRDRIQQNNVVGSFKEVGTGTSYLTQGVWINSNAIINAFSSADTITMGISNLLTAMNNAVQGYWNLQVLSAEPEVIGLRVIDAGLSKPVDKPLIPIKGDFIAALPTDSPTRLTSRLKADIAQFANSDGSEKYLYVFNRKLQKFLNADLGSELLDINIDASMPNVIAVQAIAGVGGVAQRGLLASIDVDELKAISMFDTYPASNTPAPNCSDQPTPGVANNSNGTISTVDAGRIVAAVQFPQYIEGGKSFETLISEIETKAFEDWKTKNKEALEAKTITEEAGKELVNTTISGLRKAPVEIYERNNPGLLGLVREFAATYGQAIDLVENNVSKIIALLDVNRTTQKVHPFNVSNLTKTIVDLTIPGIGGILLFQAFMVDRVPNILERGYYIVTKVAHEFSVESGWTTKIQGRFRFKENMQGDIEI